MHGTLQTLECAAPTHVQTPLPRPARAAAFYLALHHSGTKNLAPSSDCAEIALHSADALRAYRAHLMIDAGVDRSVVTLHIGRQFWRTARSQKHKGRVQFTLRLSALV